MQTSSSTQDLSHCKMGSISSKTPSTTNSDVPNSCEDCSSFFHSLTLPPYPPEVDVHIQKWKRCQLLHKTLTLEETACSGNLVLPRQREYLVHEPIGLRRVRDDQKNLALVICLVSNGWCPKYMNPRDNIIVYCIIYIPFSMVLMRL